MALDSGAGARMVADRYRIERELGRGGMGIVWQALDTALHRPVAVKEVLLPGHLTADERAQAHARVRREAQTAARVSHPSVITIHDVFDHEGHPWVVMELISGSSMQQVMAREGTLPPARVAAIAAELLEAVRAAHATGVVHRDIKPGNIMVREQDRIVLTDFGIATMEGGDAITRTGALVGSPEFMSPERLQGEDGHGAPAADLWSVGITLFAALEGRSPFRRDTMTAAIAAVLSAPIPPLPATGRLGSVITGLLERDPAARLTADTALELLRDRTADTPGVPEPDTTFRSGPNTPPPAPGTSGTPGTSGPNAAYPSGPTTPPQSPPSPHPSGPHPAHAAAPHPPSGGQAPPHSAPAAPPGYHHRPTGPNTPPPGPQPFPGATPPSAHPPAGPHTAHPAGGRSPGPGKTVWLVITGSVLAFVTVVVASAVLLMRDWTEYETFNSGWYDVQYPADWEVDDSGIGSEAYVRFTSDDDHLLYVDSWRNGGSDPTTSYGWVEAGKESFRESSEFSDLQVLESAEVDSGGFPADWDVAHWSAEFSHNGWQTRNRYFATHLITIGADTYTVTLNVPADERSDHEAIYNTAVQSFQPH
ncbi:hypothetical protein GCM10027570_49200 [Streptomonospora sediminis]